MLLHRLRYGLGILPRQSPGGVKASRTNRLINMSPLHLHLHMSGPRLEQNPKCHRQSVVLRGLIGRPKSLAETMALISEEHQPLARALRRQDGGEGAQRAHGWISEQAYRARGWCSSEMRVI
jgi:hypothetical protein